MDTKKNTEKAFDQSSNPVSSHSSTQKERQQTDPQKDDHLIKTHVADAESIEAEQNSMRQPDYVVGVGASAGGLEALETLFLHMPFRTGMAYVIVQHLSPDYKSMMDELLARKTMIPIKVAEDQMPIEPDYIYLLPPKKEMIAANGRLYLTEREQTDTVNLPINTFFRSMAETYQEKSIAIVLSGTGSDGSKGVIQVHDSGGFVIAQAPGSCKFDSMPENAIKTDRVDLIVDPENIADALIKYSKRTAKVEQQLNLGDYDAEMGEFSEILILLNNRFDLDFSQYKPSTITRRLERRVSYQKSGSLRQYIDVLLSNKEELEALYYDLLIGVTRFFRDTAAFASLKTCIPKLLAKFKDEPEIRIWVSACASGQEAYSLAIMMFELMEGDPNGNKPFKIFATDIHNKSIQIAAAGIYDKEDVEHLDSSYLERFFTKQPNNKYQVTSKIRKAIVFAQHNLLKDPPFTRTHLVSCRNLLIYFNVSAQQRVLSLLSFSLMNQGLLFIGPSEAIGRHTSDFEVIDAVHRLFRKTRSSGRHLDMPMPVNVRHRPLNTFENTPSPDRNPLSLKSRKALEVLLQRYVPASVLIDEKGDILHVFGDAGKFLSLSFGAASLNLRTLVDGSARATITQMIHHICKNYKPIKTQGVKGFNHYEAVDIEMSVLSESPGDLDYIIVSLRETEVVAIQDNQSSALGDPEQLEALILNSENIRIKELEESLVYAQESLQTTVEELESSNEELQASNEELMASNEELQSTNEELQSVNEELFSVNAEFQQKERERDELKSDERSMIDESNLGILFLDKDLKIRKFSPLAAQLFHLIDSDFGRPFSVASGPIMENIHADIYSVFQGGNLIEREVMDEHGAVYMMRVNAHLNDSVAKNIINENENENDNEKRRGIVITFTNISKLHASQIALKQTQERFQNTLNAISDGYFEWSIETDDTFFSPVFYQKLGYEDERPVLSKLLGDYTDTFKTKVEQVYGKDQHFEDTIPFITKKGKEQWMVCKGDILLNKEQKQAKLTGILIDFSEQKAVEHQLHQQALELERSNELLEKFAYIVSHDMKAPIRHIQNYLMFLEEAIAKNDAQGAQKEIQSLKDNTEGLTELIDDLITYARVTSEKTELVDINLNDIIDTVNATLAPIVKEKKITFKVSDIPLLRGDKSLLTHLFQNLIGNACKYNDKETPVITISHAVSGKYCVITVRDNGIGFDENYSKKIFDPFKRLVTKAKYEGSGIGLSICKTVVEQHGGSIAAESTLGEGAAFIVSLPI